jgi:hypothetical protein
MTAIWQYLDAHLWAAVVVLLALLCVSTVAIRWAALAIAANEIRLDDGEY